MFEPNHDDVERFDEHRRRFAEEVDLAREAGWDEERLGEVLAAISEAAEAELERQFGDWEPSDPDDGHGMVSAVEAWASVMSYATTCFYAEGPESIFRGGGFDMKNVTSRLQDTVKKLVPYVEKAYHVTGASGFSISIGFPLGISVGLSWG
jgi:hypothetical protein